MRHHVSSLPPSGSPATLAVAVGVAIGLAWIWGTPAETAAQRPAAAGATTGGLWISDSAVDEGRRMLVIVDPASRHAAVYHVETATGAMTLRSTRDISWDLMVGDFNAREPKPAALRKMLQAAPPGAELPQ